MQIKIRVTDRKFSEYIRSRDGWVCQRCLKQYEPGSSGLQNSHYWGRVNESTRFEPDNCISLCFGCHRLWGHGDERDMYKEFMIKKLGLDRFKSLDVQAHTYQKKDDKLMRIVIQQLMKTL